MRKVSQVSVTATVALVAAGLAALAVALLPLAVFVVAILACGATAVAVWGWIRRERRQAARQANADARAAQLAELQHEADILKAREQAVEKAQLAVIADFRREHGL